MEALTQWVKPELLQKFREIMSLQPKEVEQLAQELNRSYYAPVTRQELERWEQGLASPTLEQLETLSEIYSCPLGYFFLEELPDVRFPLSYRGLAQGKEGKLSPLTQQTLHRFLDFSEWITTLIEESDLDWKVSIEPEKQLNLQALVEHERERLGFSEEVRQQWNRAEDAFVWWRSRIEAQGVFCFEMKLEPNEVRGASLWVEQRYPFILVNHHDAEATSGRLFTILHEYAHLLTAETGIACDFRGLPGQGLEPLANRFAARMLVAPEQLREILLQAGKLAWKESWSDAELDELRKPFFVSRDVVAITLQEINLAPTGFYQKKREQWERRKPGGRARAQKPLTKIERKAREIGISTLQVLLAAEHRNSLPILDAAYALDMKVEKTTEFLKWASGSTSSSG